jgi:hypothetical protein
MERENSLGRISCQRQSNYQSVLRILVGEICKVQEVHLVKTLAYYKR